MTHNHFTATNGEADPGALRVVLLHGFTQTGASWEPVLQILQGQGLTLVAPDLPGHGHSPVSHDSSTLAESAARLAHSFGPALWVGYSMGGRLALRLALDHPHAVKGTVLIGATAGIDTAEARSARRDSDLRLAQKIMSRGTAAFIEQWLTLDLFHGLTIDPADLASRRANRPAGLAASLTAAGTGTMDPAWWPELAEIESPTTVVAGEQDRKFSALAKRLVDGINQGAQGPASLHVVAGAGHAVHLQAPKIVADLVKELARRIGG